MTAPSADDLLSRLTAAQRDDAWDAVLGLLAEHWSELFQNHPAALLDMLSALPDEVLAQNSRLRLADQYLRRTLDHRPETRAYRDIIADDPGASPVDRLAALTGRIAVSRGAGRHDDAIEATERAVAMLREVPVEVIPAFANALPEFHYHWGVAYLLVARFSDAMEQFVQSHDWAVSVGNVMVTTRSGGSVALLHALHGRCRDAETWLAKLPEAPADAWWAADAGTPAKLASAIIRTERLDPDAARVVLAGIDISISLDFWGPYYALRAFLTPDHRADAQLLLSEFDAFTADLATEYANVPLNAEYTALVRYTLLQMLHQPDRAARILDPAPLDVDSSVVRQTGATLHALRLALLDQSAAARRIVAPLLHASSARPRVLIPTLLVAAHTDAIAHRDELLQRAVALATWHRCHAVLTFVPETMRDELVALVRAQGDDEIADRLEAIAPGSLVRGTDALTRREAAVIEAALAGLSNAEIAARQHVSVNTVKSHLRSAFRKLEVSNRDQLQQLFQLGR